MVHRELRRKTKWLTESGNVINIDLCVDSGAAVSLIDKHVVSTNSLSILPTDGNLTLQGAFDGSTTTNIIGHVPLRTAIDDDLVEINFQVANSDSLSQTLLGWPQIKRLGLTIHPNGDIITPGGRHYGEKIPVTIRLLSSEQSFGVSCYNIKAAESCTVKIDNYLTYSRGNQTVIAATKPRVISEDDVYNHLTEMPPAGSSLELEHFNDDLLITKMTSVNKTLSKSQKSRILKILRNNMACLTNSKTVIGNVKESDFIFEQTFTEDPLPVRQYGQNDSKKRFVDVEIRKLTDMGVLEEVPPSCVKTVTSQMLTLQKKSIPGEQPELRCVLDLRLINTITVPSNHMLIDMDSVLDQVKSYKYFISCDICKAFWSLSIHPSQRKYFVLQSPITLKLYQMVKMPMGSKNSSQVWQNFISSVVLSDINDCLCYIDDIFLMGNDVDTLLKNFDKLLKRLVRYNLKINLNKIHSLLNTECSCFGFIASQHGLKPDPKRVESLVNMKKPNTKKLLLSAIASFNYYRRSVLNFSIITASLYEMTHRKSKFEWTSKTTKDWLKLKQALIDHVLLTKRNASWPLILQTDASIEGMGAILLQQTKSGDPRPHLSIARERAQYVSILFKY